MAKLLTFSHNATGRAHAAWAVSLAAAVVTWIAAPVAACEKAAPTLVAKAPARPSGAFTGEFVNGAPVYRLPSITVVGRREAEVAKTQRDARRSRPG